MGDCACVNCNCEKSTTLRYCPICKEETSQIIFRESWVCTVCQISDISYAHSLSGSK